MRDEMSDIHEPQLEAAEVAETGEAVDEVHPPLTMRAKPDGGSDPAGEAGWYLERERLSRGETLEQAGEATGIHPYHIEAIEYGDMTAMPARLEALEMIGVYAQYLGFDPDPLVRHYARFLPRPTLVPQASHPANPAPLSSAKVLKFGRMPKLPKFSFNTAGIPGGTGGLVASVAGAIMLFAGVSWMLQPAADLPANDQVAQTVDTMPTASTGPDTADVKVTDEALPDDAPLPVASTADDTAGTNLEGLTALIEENAGEPVAPAKAAKAKTAKSGVSPVPEPINPGAGIASADDVKLTPEGREFGARTGGDRLLLKARAPVWVRIEDAQGNVVMTQMLMKGDTYRVPDRDGLVVIARDGGLLSYVIDGQEKGVLGTPGEILAGRSLDLKALDGQG
jgi:cytoskeleton protein RodZ